MRTITRTQHLGEAGLAHLRLPLDDLLREESDGPDRWICGEGPFDHYVRTIEVGEPDANGLHIITETVEFELAIPLWRRLFQPLVTKAIHRRGQTAEAADRLAEAARDGSGPQPPGPDDEAEVVDRPPWWSPPDRLDARASRVLSMLCGMALLTGYLGALVTQTITFAADQFGASKAAQGSALAAARTGVLVSLIIMTIADRRGRQRLIVVCAVAGSLAAATGALAPTLLVLGFTQFWSRAFGTALTLLIAVVAAEEMPAGGRAYAASVIAMTGALGAGGAVLLLPLADTGTNGWRILYLAPLVTLPFFARLARRIPESRRFTKPHGKATMAGHRGRLLLLGASTFFGLLFLAPVTQFQNDYLRDEHGFSALGLSIFTICTNTPAGIGIVVGGRLADVRGRRIVGAVGTAGGASLLALAFNVGGPALWLAWVFGAMVAAATVPALAVYGPELFPTALRGRANAIITLTGVLGGVVGLNVAGRLGDHWGRLGPGLALLGVGPLIVSAMVIVLYPETAHVELEDLNPEDAALIAAPSAYLP